MRDKIFQAMEEAETETDETAGIIAYSSTMTEYVLHNLRKRVQELTQENLDSGQKQNNTKELLKICDDMFEAIRQLKTENNRVELKNKRLKDAILKAINEPDEPTSYRL